MTELFTSMIDKRVDMNFMHAVQISLGWGKYMMNTFQCWCLILLIHSFFTYWFFDILLSFSPLWLCKNPSSNCFSLTHFLISYFQACQTARKVHAQASLPNPNTLGETLAENKEKQTIFVTKDPNWQSDCKKRKKEMQRLPLV